MFPRRLTRIGLAGALAAFMALVAVATARRPAPGPAAAEPPGTHGDAGLRAHRDPITGRMFVPPPDAATGSRRGAVLRSTLTPEPSPVPGGGMMVDLRGAFRSGVTGERSAGGEIRVDCTRASDE